MLLCIGNEPFHKFGQIPKKEKKNKHSYFKELNNFYDRFKAGFSPLSAPFKSNFSPFLRCIIFEYAGDEKNSQVTVLSDNFALAVSSKSALFMKEC